MKDKIIYLVFSIWFMGMMLAGSFIVGKYYSYNEIKNYTKFIEVEQCRGKYNKTIAGYRCYETLDGAIVLRRMK